MTDEEIKKHLFTIEATRIAAQVQHACVLASLLESPVYGFDIIHKVLNSCLQEVSEYENRLMKESGWVPVAVKEDEKDDGN